MKPLEQEVFICLDCETTGLDAEVDQIIEVAVAKFNFGGIIEEFESLINPNCIIPETSIAIHHITPEMVKDKPNIDQVLPQILNMVGNHTVVGHGVQFDMQIIDNAAKRHNIPSRIRNNLYLDTLRLARLYGESPVNSLEQLRRHFNIEYEGTHRAMGDVLVNIGVFRNLCRAYKSVDHVFEALSRPVLMRTMPLGKHKGRLLKEIPLEYLLWAARQEFDQDLLFTLRSEIKRRKKGNLFSQATNPFANL